VVGAVAWWGWTILWVLLVLGSLGVLFLVGRSLWRKGTALFEELGTASERLAVVSEELETLAGRPAAEPELAVFADPVGLRREHDRARRRRLRAKAKRAGARR
jgi:hypothetical protein